MKPGGYDSPRDSRGRGLLGLARIKTTADRAIQMCRPAAAQASMRSPRPGVWKSAVSTFSTVLGGIAAISIICMVLVPLLRARHNTVMDVRYLDRPIKDSTFRSIGEKAAKVFPGYQNMGLQPSSKRSFMTLEESQARASCKGSGHTQGAPQMTVFVTGAAGFIGSHAAMMIRRRGHGVLGFDNFNDYYPVSLKRARQANALSNDVYIVDGDLVDKQLLRRLFSLCAFTHVLHLAAQAGVRYATSNPYSYVHSNILGHVTLLETIAHTTPMPRLVFASSSSVYGLNKKQPFSESDRVDNPASLYASTKRADELISHTYYNIYGMSVTGLRFFTVYGPWGRPDMAAYKFAKNIMMGKPISIFQGPGETELSRDFTYIDDTVDGILAALAEIPPSGKGKAHYVLYNLGNTHPQTVTQMVDLLEHHLGKKAIRNYIPVPPTGDVLATFADISAAKQELGYRPQMTLDEGIQRFCEWFVRYYNLRADTGRPGDKEQQAADWSYNPL